MSLAEEIGKWSLRHPVAVLSGCAMFGSVAMGAALGGLTGAASGAVTALVLTALIASVEPKEPAYTRHQ